MAFTTPKFLGPDGKLREEQVYTTTVVDKFFFGEVDPLTVEVQVSVRGDPFTANPDLVVFEGSNFTIPNPQVFPEGLSLVAGENEIRVRAISNVGTASDPAITLAKLILDSDIGFIAEAPTNIKIERFDNSVNVRVEGVEDPNFLGFNFYASISPGGGASGYTRINVNPGTNFKFEEKISELTTLVVDSGIVKNNNGTPVADPLFFKLYGAQVRGPDLVSNLEDVELDERLAADITFQEQEQLISTDFNTLEEIPEVVGKIRTTTKVDSVRDIAIYTFLHNRNSGVDSIPSTIPYGSFASLDNDSNLYYVVTALYFDSVSQTEFESSFSTEVSGNPLTVTSTIGTFPLVTRQRMDVEITGAIERVRPQISLVPGSVTRDTVIDPITSELERVRFILEFLNQSQSFPLLLQVDGLDENKNSLPVPQSSRKLALKRAFFLSNDADVQSIVDAAFERLAANYQRFRRPGDKSRGEVSFFTSSRPQNTLPFPSGTIVASGSVRFQTTADASIPIERLASFFNPVTGRYSVTVPIRAVEPGSEGDVGRGQIRTLEGSLSGVSVINTANTIGGKSRDTNHDLSVRTENRMASVDTGREQGYLNIVGGVSGVRDAFVVSAGDPLMQRDFDETLGRHLGGKVDVYVRGRNNAVVTDNFAFTFEIAENIQFTVLGDPSNLEFTAIDPNLSPANPIIEMLDDQTLEFELKNASTGEVFDLTDVVIKTYNTIALSTTISQPNLDLSDVVYGDYRYRTGEKFVLLRQPVTSLTLVTGSVTGVLPEENFTLVRTSSPLDEGASVRAEDFLQIISTTSSTGVTIPSGELIEVESEPHVFIGEAFDFVNNLGANPLTIEIFNFDRTVKYKGPDDPSGIPDYVLQLGTQTVPVGIRRTPTTSILSGQQLVIDYRHEENFSVEYVINNIPAIVQNEIDQLRNLTGDILVKQTVQVPINITATIVLSSDTTRSDVDSEIRAKIKNFLDGLRRGVAFRESDVIGILEFVVGVSYVIVPLTTLVRGEGAPILREVLSTTQKGDITFFAGDPQDPISTSTVSVFLIDEPLTAATTNGGGPLNDFRGVFQDDFALNLQVVRPETLGSSVGNAFIIGNDGLSIFGFSDDATLRLEFPNATDQELEQKRKNKTSNRIMVSVSVDDSPLNHSYTVTYIVSEENEGVRSIEPGPLEELVVGDLLFIYEVDRVTQRTTT